MDDLETIRAIGSWVSGVGATGVLVFVIWRLESNKWKTEASHKEVVDKQDQKHKEVVEEVRRSEQRAWGMVDKLTEARTEDNAVMEKFSDRISDLARVVDSLRSTIENQRARR